VHQSGELEEILTKAGVVEPAPQAKA